jgi:predicted secreted protein
MLPFGVRTHDEAGIEKIPGQADSAPANFNPTQIMLRATVVATICFALYYANYVQGWVTMTDLDFFGDPPSYDGTKTD